MSPDQTPLAQLVARYNVDLRPADVGHMVTVAQLRAALANFPDDAYVVLAKDPEGNGYSPLSINSDDTPSVEAVWYLPECTWAGEVAPIGPDGDGDIHEPRPGDLIAVCLDPVN